jgi:predicted transcriptional regulator
MRYSKLTSIRIDGNKFIELEKLAEEKETSVGSLIRQAISKYLLENPTK